MNDFKDAVKTLKREHGYSIIFVRRAIGVPDLRTGKATSADTRFTIKKAVRADSNQLIAAFPSSIGQATTFGGLQIGTVIKYIIDHDDIKNHIDTPKDTSDFILDGTEFYKIIGVNRLSDKSGYIVSCRIDPTNVNE